MEFLKAIWNHPLAPAAGAVLDAVDLPRIAKYRRLRSIREYDGAHRGAV